MFLFIVLVEKKTIKDKIIIFLNLLRRNYQKAWYFPIILLKKIMREINCQGACNLGFLFN